MRLVMSGVMSLLAETPLGGNLIFHYTLKDIVLYIVKALYFVLFTYNTGTTIGKRAMNLRVVNKDGSTQLTFLNVIYRETIGRFLCKVTVGIGYLIAGFDPEKRGLQDMLCDTQVIYAKTVKVYEKVQRVPERITVPNVDGFQIKNEVADGYHLTDKSKVDIVDEENINENNLQ